MSHLHRAASKGLGRGMRSARKNTNLDQRRPACQNHLRYFFKLNTTFLLHFVIMNVILFLCIGDLSVLGLQHA